LCQLKSLRRPCNLRSDRTRSARNENRRRILESELQNEQQLPPTPGRSSPSRKEFADGDERNYARVLDRLKPYQEAVSQHTKNIEQLRAGSPGRLR
jgi:hypothetical protein